MIGRRLRPVLLWVLGLTVASVGCAKRPGLLSRAAAPSPAKLPREVAPAAAVEHGEAAQRLVEPSKTVVADTRPAPAIFSENAALNNVYFDFDRYTIRQDAARALEANAAWLKTNNMLILIEGQCDERGTVEYNLVLGDRRGKAAMNYLVAQGVAASRSSLLSLAKERPVCTEHDEACWRLNRRAHVLVKPRGEGRGATQTSSSLRSI